MTTDKLREFKNKMPFKPFTIHMNDGRNFVIDDPENLVLHRDWTVDAIVLLPRGHFSFLYLRNVTDVSSQGTFPRIKGRRRGKGTSDSE